MDTHLSISLVDKISDPVKGLCWVFKVNEYFTSNPDIAVKTAFGLKINNIRDLPADIEHRIVKFQIDKINEIVANSNKCMVIIDLTDFPHLMSYIYRENPEPPFDKFSTDVFNMWWSYDITNSVPLILVNANLPFTALKLIHFDRL